jgi:hypothetical protein
MKAMRNNILTKLQVKISDPNPNSKKGVDPNPKKNLSDSKH